MKREIKPLKVSPAIKTARWSLLFLGILYGTSRNRNLTIYDAKLQVIRARFLEEKKKKEYEDNQLNIIRDIKALVKEIDIGGEIEIPPEFRD